MRQTILGLLALLTLAGCANVTQMQRKYEAGDLGQLDKLMKIVARPDYPYGTRKRAATALGEIGDPRAVPVLIGVLHDYDQRTTLKKEALVGLGRIGDTTAVASIGKLMDRALIQDNSELRMAALPVLGELGGPRAAETLVNALRYYDFQMMRDEQRVRRGPFSGEEMPVPHMYGRDRRDSTRVMDPRAGMGGLMPGQGAGPVNMFGMDSGMMVQDMYNPTPEERALAHQALVRVGEDALPVIDRHRGRRDTSPSLAEELRAIADEIRGPQPVPAPGSVAPAEDGQ